MRSVLFGIVAFAVALAPGRVRAQSHEGHAGHALPAPAAPTATVRLMAPQPVIGDVPLVDHLGRETTLRKVLETDGPVLVNFIFTSCTTICPVMTAGFAQFQASLGEERDGVRLVSISIDPDVDNIPTLRKYADRYRAGASWRFLTGTRDAVVAAQRVFGAFRGDKSNHAPATYLRRSPQSPWEALDGLSSADALLRAYRGGDHGAP